MRSNVSSTSQQYLLLQHFNIECRRMYRCLMSPDTSRSTCIATCALVRTGLNTALQIQFISKKIFVSNTKYLMACCSLWKLHSGQQVSGDYISSGVPNVSDKLGVTTNVTRIIGLKVRFPSQITLFPQNNLDHLTYHYLGDRQRQLMEEVQNFARTLWTQNDFHHVYCQISIPLRLL